MLLACAGSVLLNALIVLLAALAYASEFAVFRKKETSRREVTPDLFQVVRKSAPEEEKKAAEKGPDAVREEEEEAEKRRPGFMRTSEEQEVPEAPKDPAYIGQRNTRLASEREASPDGLENLPSVNGEKKRNDADLSLIDQRGQMGDLEHERKGREGLDSPSVAIQREPRQAPSVPRPPSPALPPVPAPAPRRPADPALPDAREPAPAEAVSAKTDEAVEGKEGKNEADKGREGDSSSAEARKDQPDRENDSQQDDDARPGKAAETPPEDRPKPEDKPVEPEPQKPSKRLEEIMKTARRFHLPDPTRPLPVAPDASSGKVLSPADRPLPPRRPAAPVYDPAFPGGSRAGYKQESHKTRITGQMSASGALAANVKSTPLGLYQAQFMRMLNRNWDAECVARRDFIIPGSLKIRLVLNRNGKVNGIRLLAKEGASEVQKGFTFKAIRDTVMPPMPPEAVKELGEDSTEVVIDFFF